MEVDVVDESLYDPKKCLPLENCYETNEDFLLQWAMSIALIYDKTNGQIYAMESQGKLDLDFLFQDRQHFQG